MVTNQKYSRKVGSFSTLIEVLKKFMRSIWWVDFMDLLNKFIVALEMQSSNSKCWFQGKTWLYNSYFLNLFSKLKIIHDLDDEVFVNVKAKPMWKTILTLFLAKINPVPFFFLLKGQLVTNLSLLSIKSKSSVPKVLPSHLRRLRCQECVPF